MGLRLPPDLEAKVLALAGAQAPRPTPVTHEEFQQAVIDLARSNGFDLVYHTRDSRKSAPGFPDLVIGRTRDARCVVTELKVPPDTATPEQLAWLAFFKALGLPTFLWTPADWPEIERALT